MLEMFTKIVEIKSKKTKISAIGGSKGAETSLLEFVSDYTVFSNQGIRIKPATQKFYGQNGEKFVFQKQNPERISESKSAIQVNEMLKQVLREIGLISAKIGSVMVADCWHFALNSKIVVGVWVGLPHNEIKLELDKGLIGRKIATSVAARFFRNLPKKCADCFKKNVCNLEKLCYEYIEILKI